MLLIFAQAAKTFARLVTLIGSSNRLSLTGSSDRVGLTGSWSRTALIGSTE